MKNSLEVTDLKLRWARRPRTYKISEMLGILSANSSRSSILRIKLLGISVGLVGISVCSQPALGQNLAKNLGQGLGQDLEQNLGQDLGKNPEQNSGQNLGQNVGGNLGQNLGQNLAQNSGLCVAQLPQAIEKIMADLPGSYWGMTVVTEGGNAVYDHQGDRFFIPASTQKLLTSAAAFATLGPQTHRATSFYLQRDAQGQTTLGVVGQGDPSLTRGELRTIARQMAQELQAQGISRIDNLVGDDRSFGGTFTPPTWEVQDVQAGYGAPVNSLILEDNAIPLTLHPQALGQPLGVTWDQPGDGAGWTVSNRSRTGGAEEPEWVQVGQTWQPGAPLLEVAGVLRQGAAPEPMAIAVRNPGDRFVQELATALGESGIAVAAQTLLSDPQIPDPAWRAGAPWITRSSPPVADLVTQAHRTSHNLTSEILLAWMGSTAGLGDPQALSTLERGQGVITAALEGLGVPATGFGVADGSGLSRHNLVTPQALVTLLQAMARSPWDGVYRQSLAVAGESGTLASRFQDTVLAGRFQGKTGSMTGVYALAGYVQPPQFEPVAVAVMVNHSDRGYGTLRSTLEEALLQVGRLQRCPD